MSLPDLRFTPPPLLPIPRIRLIKHAHVGLELQGADVVDVLGEGVDLPRGFLANLLRHEAERAVHGERVDLGLARGLQPVEVEEGLGDRPAHGQEAVVAEDERAVAAEVVHQPFLLAFAHDRAFVLVIADGAVEERRIQADGQEAAFQRRHRHAGRRVRVHDAVRVRRALVDRAVDGVAGCVHRPFGVAHDLALQRDLDQVGRRHLAVAEPKGVDEEVPLRPRHAHREVAVDRLVPAEMLDQPVGGGELHAELGLLGHELDCLERCRGSPGSGCAHRSSLPVTLRVYASKWTSALPPLRHGRTRSGHPRRARPQGRARGMQRPPAGEPDRRRCPEQVRA